MLNRKTTIFEKLIQLAFEIPAPNPITPQIVERVQAVERDSHEMIRHLRWAYAQIENSCPHVLNESSQGRLFTAAVRETAWMG